LGRNNNQIRLVHIRISWVQEFFLSYGGCDFMFGLSVILFTSSLESPFYKHNWTFLKKEFTFQTNKTSYFIVIATEYRKKILKNYKYEGIILYTAKLMKKTCHIGQPDPSNFLWVFLREIQSFKFFLTDFVQLSALSDIRIVGLRIEEIKTVKIKTSWIGK
jgi:hypothetical protein